MSAPGIACTERKKETTQRTPPEESSELKDRWSVEDRDEATLGNFCRKPSPTIIPNVRTRHHTGVAFARQTG
eukprot:2040550-Rhodomonas_salina.2